MTPPPPKVFISYCWGSPEHNNRVLELATHLRENGVDAIIDKWHLRPGQDATVFMEQMVTDPSITNVIMIFDRKYVEKADRREGGVGTEAQIISPKMYEKSDQTKFVAVIFEKDNEEKPYLPVFYKSRIWIDLSDQGIYAVNFDELLRSIFEKPAYPKPALGKPPKFLNEQTALLPTRSRANRAIQLLTSGSSNAKGALADYLEELSSSLEMLRISHFDKQKLDEPIVESIASFLPYRDEFIAVVSAVSRYSADDSTSIHRFFERVIPYMFRPKSVSMFYESNWDNFRFIVLELFLYVVSAFFKEERFSEVSSLLNDRYYIADDIDVDMPDRGGIYRVDIIQQPMSSFALRKRRLQLSRMSLVADLLKERSVASGLSFTSLMQADLILYLVDSIDALKQDRVRMWFPETLVYFSSSTRFELFARAQSTRYFDRIKPILGVNGKNELIEKMRLFEVPKFQRFDLADAMNLTKLATTA
jgi:TIR domain